MLKIIKNKDANALQEYLNNRNTNISDDIKKQVLSIVEDVKQRKDEALYEYTKKFDNVSLRSLQVSKDEIQQAYQEVDQTFIESMKRAASNIYEFHQEQAQTIQGFELKKADGVILGQRVLPLHRVGVYVPGGSAAYPSSVLMNVIPAKIAKVNNVIMVTPPSSNGSVNPYILVAADIANVDTIYKVGGAQAIAALAYGTDTIQQVDKIVGPGNAYVASAKQLVFGQVDIDMIAGPSEILVIADDEANAKYVAADLLSQAEHDALASSILLTTSKCVVENVCLEIEKQLKELPRQAIAEISIDKYGMAMVLDSIEKCIEVSNRIAPEHLEMMCKDAQDYLPLIQNAGSVFLGYYTCESLGDYYTGTNHVLPTNGTARFYSPLGVDSFVKRSSYSYYTKDALLKAGDDVICIAEREGLQAHANAVKVRMNNEKN